MGPGDVPARDHGAAQIVEALRAPDCSIARRNQAQGIVDLLGKKTPKREESCSPLSHAMPVLRKKPNLEASKEIDCNVAHDDVGGRLKV